MSDFGFGKVFENCVKNMQNMLLYESYFEQSNINQKPLIWSKLKTVMKFGPKKWVSLVLEKEYENCEESNINQKPLIFTHDKIIT